MLPFRPRCHRGRPGARAPPDVRPPAAKRGKHDHRGLVSSSLVAVGFPKSSHCCRHLGRVVTILWSPLSLPDGRWLRPQQGSVPSGEPGPKVGSRLFLEQPSDGGPPSTEEQPVDNATNRGLEPPSGPKGLSDVVARSRVTVCPVVSLVDSVRLCSKWFLLPASSSLAGWAMAHAQLRLITCDCAEIAAITQW